MSVVKKAPPYEPPYVSPYVEADTVEYDKKDLRNFDINEKILKMFYLLIPGAFL